MDIANRAQYFNDIAVEAYRKTVGIIRPEGSLEFINHGHLTATCIDWSWRMLNKVPEDVVAGVCLTLKPDPLGLGFEVMLTVSAHKGEERLDQIFQIYWARFIDLEYIKYDSGKFKNELTEEIAFQLRRACEHLVMVAPKLGEVSVNTERIKGEMRVLNFTLHRA